MASLIFKTIIIRIFTVSELDKNIEFAIINVFYSTVCIPFFEKRNDRIDGRTMFLQKVYKIINEFVFLFVMINIF